jgi:osmotically-inducible protein OsmY
MNLFQSARWLVLLCLLPYLFGCAAVAIGGGAVAASSAIDRRTAGTQVEDQTIEVKAIQAINRDVELKEQAHLNITSYNTVVLVSGETPTDAMRQKSIEIVSGVDKVSHVYNEITVAAPSSLVSRSSDSLITSKVKTKMITNKDLSGLQVKVVTEKGVVYLMGLLTRQESELATSIARQTGGVQKVVKLFQYTD